MNLLRLIFALLMALPLSACALSGGAVSGVVKEAGTGHPIVGAIVAVKWHYYLWHSACLHLQMATTDKNGRYHIPLQTEILFSVRPNIEVASVVAYKEGYRDIFSAGFILTLGNDYVIYEGQPNPQVTSATIESLGLPAGQRIDYHGNGSFSAMNVSLPSWWNHGEHDVFMVPDISKPSVRTQYLGKYYSWLSCPGDGSKDRNLAPLFGAISDETKRIGSKLP